MQTYFTVYKTTNLINGKFYIGQHQTKDLNDLYLGSGTSIVRAVKKYGKENFTKEILFVFDNFDEMNNKEIQLVTEHLIKDSLCYNQVTGGQGNNSNREYIMTSEHKKSISESKKGIKCDPKDVAKRASTWSAKIAMMTDNERKSKFAHYGEQNGFYNKTHNEETKQKIRETIGDSRKGSLNNNACPVELYGKKYGTKKECYTSLGISKKKLNQILGDLKMKNTSKGEL